MKNRKRFESGDTDMTGIIFPIIFATILLLFLRDERLKFVAKILFLMPPAVEKAVAIIAVCGYLAFVVQFAKESFCSYKIIREQKKHEKETDKILSHYNILKAKRYITDVVLLDEPVEENFYHHPNSTSDCSKWGVYVDRYFFECNCTANTFSCVEKLREAGVHVAYDETCIYEKRAEQ